MKHLSRFLILSIFSTLSVMVEAAIVKGILIDPELHEAEPYASVRVFRDNQDKPLYTIVTDVDGNFSQEIKKPGQYKFVFSSVGKDNLVRTVTVESDENINLGTLEMHTNATIMDELVVVAQKPLVKMATDHMTYNVSEDSDSKTQTLLDMLRKVPMVTVDGEDNISVNGSSSFQVYVDGKPSLMFSGNPSQMFKAMPASAVKSVEVVTNPGARYDAEGTGGVLNLVFDKHGKGVSALGNAYNVSVGVRGGNTCFGGNVYANAKVDRLIVSLNAMYNKTLPGESAVETSRVQGNETVSTHSSGKTRLPFTMGNLSLEYEIDSLTTVGGSFSLNGFTMNAPASSSLTTFSGSAADFSYGSHVSMRNMTNGITGSVDFSRFFDSGHNNHLTATYQIQSEHHDNRYAASFDAPEESLINLADRTSDNRESTTLHVFQADFTSHLNEKNTISIGGKGTLRNAKSDAKYYLENQYDVNESMNYDDRNSIGALYGEYSFSAEKMSAKAGLRYEYTWQSVKYHKGHGSDFKTDYGILVPSASVSCNLAPYVNIGLNYNMLISRPGITYLNPYTDCSDPTVISYGNPDLEVEKGHTVALVYNMFSSKFMMNLTLSHNFTNNGIEQYSFMEGAVMHTTYGNIVKRNKTGLNVFLNWSPFVKTRFFLNGGVNYTDNRSLSLDMRSHGWQGNAMVGIQQTLPLDFKAGTFLMASTKNHTLQGWNSGFQMFTFNLSKGFLDNDLNVSVGVTTGLSDGGRMKLENFSSDGNFTNHTSIKVPMAGFTVGVTYAFGNSKNIGMKSKKNVDGDYIEHASDMNQLSQPGIGTGM